MIDPIPAQRAALLLPIAEFVLGRIELVLLASVALILAGFFAALRSGLLHSVPSRVLESARSEREKDGLRPLLERAEALATSASVFEISAQILFMVVVLALIGSGDWRGLVLSLIVGVPPLVFACEVLPSALRGERTDTLLRSVLPLFELLQKPLGTLLLGLEGTRRATMRLLRIPEKPRMARRILEDLRDVIEESDLEHELDQAEREMIENLVEFHDVDVAEVMTPRTEVMAIDVEAGIQAVMQMISDTGHTRIPVYEGSIDTIIGLAYAQEIIRLVSEQRLDEANLRELVRPISFVPETKLVSELLGEFRHEKRKLAVVLDEYGGTAGLVTMGDIVAEIVGDMGDEFSAGLPEPIRRLDDGSVEVQAGIRISDFNVELDLELPEEADYETLAGYVLAEFGRFPKRGESFSKDNAEFHVTEANDRRVFSVRVRKLAERTSD